MKENSHQRSFLLKGVFFSPINFLPCYFCKGICKQFQCLLFTAGEMNREGLLVYSVSLCVTYTYCKLS